MSTQSAAHLETWPSLPLEAWSETYATLHLWTQIVGKIRLVQSPWANHSWHVTLYVTARGLTTSLIPYGDRSFQIDLDFIDHQLTIWSSDGGSGGFPLRPQSVAAFYARLMGEMEELQLQVSIYGMPNEVADPFGTFCAECHLALSHPTRRAKLGEKETTNKKSVMKIDLFPFPHTCLPGRRPPG